MYYPLSRVPIAGCWLPVALLLAAAIGWSPAALAQAPVFATTTYSTGATGTYSVLVADVNGDGKPDVLTTNASSNTLSVLLGTGTGTFVLQTPVISTGTGSYPFSGAVADVNGDGKLDVLTANKFTASLGVLLGTGTGSFVLQASQPATGTGSSPQRVAMADVTGDGKLDAVVLNTGSNTVAVLAGNGSSGFTLQASATSTGAGSTPWSMALADVNGDGKLDVLTANSNSSTLGILLGTGTGSFTAQTPLSTGTGSRPYGVAVADVNGDGKPDALTANAGTNTLGVLLGTGTGSFVLQPAAASTGSGSSPLSVAVADVNGDGKLDALTANNDTGNVGVLLGNGSGTFMLQSPSPSTGGGSYPIVVAVADANGDNKPDLFTANANTSTLSVLLNATTFLATTAALPGATATLAPNPAHVVATLTATGLPVVARQLTATLHDALGREVRHLLLPVAAGTVQAAVPTAGLPAGVYLLRLHVLNVQGSILGSLPAQRLVVE